MPTTPTTINNVPPSNVVTSAVKAIAAKDFLYMLETGREHEAEIQKCRFKWPSALTFGAADLVDQFLRGAEQFVNEDPPFDTSITKRLKQNYEWRVALFEEFTKGYDLEPSKTKGKAEKTFLGKYLLTEAKSCKAENNNYYCPLIRTSRVLEIRNGQVGPRSGNRNVEEEFLKEAFEWAWTRPKNKGAANSLDTLPTSPATPLSSIGGVNFYCVLLHGFYSQFAFPDAPVSRAMRFTVGSESELRAEDAEDAAGGGRVSQREEKLKRLRTSLQSPISSASGTVGSSTQSSSFVAAWEAQTKAEQEYKMIELMCKFGNDEEKAEAKSILLGRLKQMNKQPSAAAEKVVEEARDEE